MKVGEIEVLPVFDGFGYEVARDVLLRPAETDPWARHEERLYAHGRLEFTLGGFLVRMGGRTILVDAGAGTIDTGQQKGGQLLTSLDGQIPGSIAQGIGGALYEHLIYDAEGNLSTGSLLDYLMPTSAEIPGLVIGHIANPAANPLGVGEDGTLGPAAALAGAVGDALGIAVDRLPITPSGLWEFMQQELAQ